MFSYMFVSRFEHVSTMQISIITHGGTEMANTSPCPLQYLFFQLLDGLLKLLASTSTMQQVKWCGPVKLHLKQIRVMSNQLLTFCLLW